MKRPSISIVIPTNKSASRLRMVMQSLQRLELDHEVILAVNGVRPSELDSFRQSYPNTLLGYLPHANTNAARNLGARMSSADVIYFLDDDCRAPSSEAFNHLLQRFSAEPGLGAVGGAYTLDSTHMANRTYNYVSTAWLIAKSDDTGAARTLLGGNAGYRRSAFFQAGGFDERDHGCCEEYQIHLNLDRLGYEISFDRLMDVYHEPNRSPWTLLKTGLYYGTQPSLTPAETPMGATRALRAAWTNPSQSTLSRGLFFLLSGGYIAAILIGQLQRRLSRSPQVHPTRPVLELDDPRLSAERSRSR